MLPSKPGSLGNKGGRDGSHGSVPILGIRNVVLNKQIYLHFLHRGHTMRQSRTGIFTAHLLWDQLSHAAYAAPVNATRMKNGSSISAAQGIVYSAPGGKQNLASVFMPEKPVPVRKSASFRVSVTPALGGRRQQEPRDEPCDRLHLPCLLAPSFPLLPPGSPPWPVLGAWPSTAAPISHPAFCSACSAPGAISAPGTWLFPAQGTGLS